MDNPSIPAPVRQRSRKRRLLGLCLLIFATPAIFLARPGWRLWRTARNDVDHLERLEPGFTNDASRLNLTAVRDVHIAPADPAKAERELASLLAEANKNGWKVSIAGAQHMHRTAVPAKVHSPTCGHCLRCNSIKRPTYFTSARVHCGAM